MKIRHLQQLEVLFDGRRVGVLRQTTPREILFQYDATWLRDGFDLSPHTLLWTPAAQPAPDLLFEGLHGVFNDSLPDGWGLMLMDRELQRSAGWRRQEIGKLDRLAYIGDRAMGGLEYRPAYDTTPKDTVDLSELAKAVRAVLDGQTEEVLEQLRIQGGSPGGARPKVTIARHPRSGHCISGFDTVPDGYDHWLVKFRSKEDPPDMPNIEQSYAQMAQAAGVEMPVSTLVSVGIDHEQDTAFAVQRFDRIGSRKLHAVSLCGYLYADFRAPSVDYEAVLGATQQITRDYNEVLRAFRLMVFNVLTHNKDDHTKNFSFLYDGARWRLSPGYDLTFSHGMGGEHTTAVEGSGNPGAKDVLKLASRFAIKEAVAIVQQVRGAVAQWTRIATAANVSPEYIDKYLNAFTAIDQRFSKLS